MANTYSLEIKAQVLAAYEMGATKAELSRRFGVPRTTLIDWLRDAPTLMPTVTDMDIRARLGELASEYLITGLEALITQHRVGADVAYLKRAETDLPALYKSFHAGIVAVAQAIDRGESDDANP